MQYDKDRLINIKEAAELMSLSASTLYQWCAASKIPHVRLSARAVRFRISQILDFIDNKSVEINDSPPPPKQPRQTKRTKHNFKNNNNNKYLDDLFNQAKNEVLNKTQQY